MLTYQATTAGRDPLWIADFDAFLDDRELPSVMRAREEDERQKRDFVQHAIEYGGEVG